MAHNTGMNPRTHTPRSAAGPKWLAAALPMLLLLAGPAIAQEVTAATAQTHLADLLNEDVRTTGGVLLALRGTRDPSLAPVYQAALNHKDKGIRAAALQGLDQLLEAKAAPIMLEVLNSEADISLRAGAMAFLLERDALSTEQLAQAAKIPDERIQRLAGNALARKGAAEQARPILTELLKSTDPVTVNMARLSLIKAGDTRHVPAVQETIRNPDTKPADLATMLQQIREEQIYPVAQAVAYATTDEHPEGIRILAYSTLAKVAGNAAELLSGAIDAGERTGYKVRLLNILAEQKDVGPTLNKYAKEEGLFGTLATFEAARVGGNAQAARDAALAAVKTDVPLATDYVLSRAEEDVHDETPATGADLYVPALVYVINQAPADTRRLTRAHARAARSAAILVDLATPAAEAALTKILSGRYAGPKRMAAAGLLPAKVNDLAVKLAKPMLDSPYQPLATDAMLTLARADQSAALPKLKDVLKHAGRHPPEMRALASWYIIRLEGDPKTAASTVAKTLK